MSRDRDRILEQALKHELRAAGTSPDAPALRSPGEGGHLDAETLAAWADDALDATAAASCEAHVSNCSRCQALVAALARGTAGTAGTPGTLSTPGTPSTPSTVSLWKWWLAPIAAGVTAVTLWMVIPEEQRIAEAPPQPKQAAAAPTSTTAIAPPAPSAPAAAPEQFASRENIAAAGREDRQRDQAAGERKEEAPKLQERGALADAAVAPAAAPPPAAMPPPAAVALEARPAAPEVGALQKSARTNTAIEVATLDPSLGWRIAGDRIERSDNGGRTWAVKRQDASDGIAAGSAPSNSVAWFVGRAGRVLLTTDAGASFTDVSLAEPLDLASVAATDARNAMIFSVVGRRFRTDDGGRTWRPY